MNTIDTLAATLEAAKAEEARAAQARLEAETALIDALGVKDEGAQTHRGESYRVTITGVINRRIDPAALSALADRIPTPLLLQAVRYKPEPIAAGIRYLRNNEPETYAVLAEALTVTPGKPQVRVEFVGAMKEAA